MKDLNELNLEIELIKKDISIKKAVEEIKESIDKVL